MYVFIKCFVCVLCVKYVFALNEGDPCMANNDAGVCKILDDCDYAVKLLTIDEKKPPMCRWKGSTRIVCCPLQDRSYNVGAFRSYFGGSNNGVLRSQDMFKFELPSPGPLLQRRGISELLRGSNNGVLRSQDMTCRYDGSLPILCCQNVPEAAPPAEPVGCPPLQLPSGDRNDIPFKKCLEYQRYVNVCVSSDSNPDSYVREDTCSVESFGDRITGGTPAHRNEFPHMALLGCRNTVNTGLGPVVWVAGGSLISDRFILTAGHVLSHRDYGLLRYVLLGATNKSEARDGLLFNIIRFIPHKLYQKNEKKHDIALLELDRRVEFSEFIRPACLPSPAIPITTDRILAGWGKTGEQASESQVLMKVTVPEYDYESYCKQFFSQAADNLFDKETMLCAAGGKGDNKDSCQGDSGGPMMAYARDIHCSFVVRGIVSFGPRCGAGVPGVYTNVQYYMAWIQSVVWPK
ncbi:serine protease 48-like [Cydia strobilella]|uniref:serine protease 48-like n=1 Tax=Cydia strobilella TaxID=1100964 RepID=UPI0030076626